MQYVAGQKAETASATVSKTHKESTVSLWLYFKVQLKYIGFKPLELKRSSVLPQTLIA